MVISWTAGAINPSEAARWHKPDLSTWTIKYRSNPKKEFLASFRGGSPEGV